MLDLGDNSLLSLPQSLAALSGLRELWLDGNSLSLLPPALCTGLCSLTSLDLSSNKLQQLPLELGHLSSLTHLFLSHNLLDSLPPSLASLPLSIVKLDHNLLSSLPGELGRGLHLLTELLLDNNQLASLPLDLSGWRSLSYLSLNSNRLSSLPGCLASLHCLSLLSARDNLLASLPPKIGALTCLRVLDLRGNCLSCLPASMVGLRLAALWLAENQARPLAPLSWQKEGLTCYLLPQVGQQDKGEESVTIEENVGDCSEDSEAYPLEESCGKSVSHETAGEDLVFLASNEAEKQRHSDQSLQSLPAVPGLESESTRYFSENEFHLSSRSSQSLNSLLQSPVLRRMRSRVGKLFKSQEYIVYRDLASSASNDSFENLNSSYMQLGSD